MRNNRGRMLYFRRIPINEQMLINLVRNAADAVLETSSNSLNATSVATESESENVKLHWDTNVDDVVLTIDDNGPGLSNPSNVFTPFYTTKPNGSGVGLGAFSPDCQAHGGRVEIESTDRARLLGSRRSASIAIQSYDRTATCDGCAALAEAFGINVTFVAN